MGSRSIQFQAFREASNSGVIVLSGTSMCDLNDENLSQSLLKAMSLRD